MADIEEYYGIYCDSDGSALMEAMNTEEDYAYGEDGLLDVMDHPSKNDNRANTFEQSVNKLNECDLSTLNDVVALITCCRRGTDDLQTALATYIGLDDKFYEWADYIMTCRKRDLTEK